MVIFGEESLVKVDLKGLCGHLVWIGIVGGDELVETELVVFPLPILEGVVLEGVLEISPEHINQILQFYPLL